ncbi:MAG: TetR/AcrR family transcriptional regulator [Actinomycetota bacterium]|nr:TetR/AcrR family transcriptional regulator [Actinomycetota bacterium]
MSTTTTPRAPRRDAMQNRAALLAAARVVLNRDPDAGLDAIAVEAGLTRRSVYGHFANRDALLKELISSGAARVAAALAGVDHPEPLVRIALIGSRLWLEVENVRVMSAFAVSGPFQFLVVARLMPIRRHLLDAVVEGASSKGDFVIRRDMAPETVARLIEGAAIAVLNEATRTRMGAATGRRLVMLAVLSMAGLDAAAAGRLIERTPELGGQPLGANGRATA